jgi:hypothetical protein
MPCLGAVNRDGIPVREAVLGELVASEPFEAAVVHANDQRLAFEVDGDDVAAFRGDDLAVGGGGEGHNPVAHAVVAATGSARPPTSAGV